MAKAISDPPERILPAKHTRDHQVAPDKLYGRHIKFFMINFYRKVVLPSFLLPARTAGPAMYKFYQFAGNDSTASGVIGKNK
ncbi:MAG: hypothetical protein BGO09_13680 [Bacteroidetes bacterium 47-18]|nr:MAG: hypothetical protein BGO09_13680 [Bacteroidetes bacterium 47-18]